MRRPIGVESQDADAVDQLARRLGPHRIEDGFAGVRNLLDVNRDRGGDAHTELDKRKWPYWDVPELPSSNSEGGYGNTDKRLIDTHDEIDDPARGLIEDVVNNPPLARCRNLPPRAADRVLFLDGYTRWKSYATCCWLCQSRYPDRVLGKVQLEGTYLLADSTQIRSFNRNYTQEFLQGVVVLSEGLNSFERSFKNAIAVAFILDHPLQQLKHIQFSAE